MLAHHLQRSAAIKPTINQRLMAWWEICWIHTNSLPRWPLTTAIIASARWQSVIGTNKHICRPPATLRRQSKGGISMPLMDHR